jgi:hypothetical protein
VKVRPEEIYSSDVVLKIIEENEHRSCKRIFIQKVGGFMPFFV